MQKLPVFPGGRANAVTTPRVSLPVSARSLEKILAGGGMPAVAERILNGETHKEIAASLDVPRSHLSGWLVNQTDPLYREAMRESAESLLDQAQIVLEGAGRTMPEVAIARELAALYLFRASVRNHHYSTKGASINIETSAPSAPPSFTICILPSPNREERVIEGANGDTDVI